MCPTLIPIFAFIKREKSLERSSSGLGTESEAEALTRVPLPWKTRPERIVRFKTLPVIEVCEPSKTIFSISNVQWLDSSTCRGWTKWIRKHPANTAADTQTEIQEVGRHTEMWHRFVAPDTLHVSRQDFFPHCVVKNGNLLWTSSWNRWEPLGWLVISACGSKRANQFLSYAEPLTFKPDTAPKYQENISYIDACIPRMRAFNQAINKFGQQLIVFPELPSKRRGNRKA